MTKTLLRVLSITFLCVLAVTVAVASENGAIRIFLPKTGASGHARGYLPGYSGRAAFVLAAYKGQRLSVLTSQGGATVITVDYVDGSSESEPEGIAVNIRQAADVTVIVTEAHMSQPWAGPFTLDITLR
jgi:hypothetical protein